MSTTLHNQGVNNNLSIPKLDLLDYYSNILLIKHYF